MKLYGIPEHDLETVVAQFVGDYLQLVRHVLLDHDAKYAPMTCLPGALEPIIDSVRRREIMPVESLSKMVAWVCYVTTETQEARALNPDELAAHDAAWRLSDALNE